MKIFFPYEKIRESQDEFIKDVLECVEQKKHLIAHAPTGIGKTAGVLSSLLPAILEKDKTLFFLTSRHTQHRIAIETLKEIKKKHNLNLNVADLIGKRNMCNQFGVDAMGSQFYDFCRTLVEDEECEFYENTYSNIGYSFESRNFLESNKGVFHVEEFLDIARKTRLCPYELAIIKAKNANVVVADYNYVFNANIRDAFFKKANKFLEKSVIIVDEAHNLPGRLRDMMSSILSTYILERALREAEKYEEAFAVLQMIKERFDKICSNLEDERLVGKDEFFINEFSGIIDILEIVSDDLLNEKKRSFVKFVSEFLQVWNGEDNGFIRYIEKENIKDKVSKANFKLHYKCLDPSFLMKDAADKSMLVLMSGTLLPLEMYRDLLGIKDALLKEYENPFPVKNKLSLVVPHTTTKFTRRNEEMFKLIARKCNELCSAIPGNILLLFPSYEIMRIVNENFSAPGKSVFMEIQGMQKEEKEEINRPKRRCRQICNRFSTLRDERPARRLD